MPHGLLGAGSARVVFSILIPLARRSLLAAAVLSFLHTVGEFGVVLMLGGDIPGATRTLSILLYNQVENFDYAAAESHRGHSAEPERSGTGGHLHRQPSPRRSPCLNWRLMLVAAGSTCKWSAVSHPSGP